MNTSLQKLLQIIHLRFFWKFHLKFLFVIIQLHTNKLFLIQFLFLFFHFVIITNIFDFKQIQKKRTSKYCQKYSDHYKIQNELTIETIIEFYACIGFSLVGDQSNAQSSSHRPEISILTVIQYKQDLTHLYKDLSSLTAPISNQIIFDSQPSLENNIFLDCTEMFHLFSPDVRYQQIQLIQDCSQEAAIQKQSQIALVETNIFTADQKAQSSTIPTLMDFIAIFFVILKVHIVYYSILEMSSQHSGENCDIDIYHQNFIGMINRLSSLIFSGFFITYEIAQFQLSRIFQLCSTIMFYPSKNIPIFMVISIDFLGFAEKFFIVQWWETRSTSPDYDSLFCLSINYCQSLRFGRENGLFFQIQTLKQLFIILYHQHFQSPLQVQALLLQGKDTRQDSPYPDNAWLTQN